LLPELGLWLDPHEPKAGPEKVFVSHAHSDHTAAHREVILSAATSRLMRARVPGERLEHVLEFNQPACFQNAGVSYQLTLVPAGHIFGSAMALIEAEDSSLLFTGDFKLRRGFSAEPCEPRKADVLIMETTYGRPQYVFPPTADVLQGIARFCREALDNDETPVLLGYSLGKSQELLSSLVEARFPLMLHGTIYNLTRIYEQFGQSFPPYEKYEAGSARGKVLLCPPNVINSAMLRNLAKTRTAIITGWAVDPNCRYRYQCDAAFPMSDHADFPDLLEMVKRVQPKLVYTLHGFAADFARTLRDRGVEARALSQDEQLVLGIESESKVSILKSKVAKANSVGLNGKGQGTVGVPAAPEQLPAHRFVRFAEACSKIAGDSRKLEKVRIVSEYLRELDGESAALAATWFSGRPFPTGHNKVLQLGWAVLRDALCGLADIGEQDFHQVYLKHSDAGESAAEILAGQTVGPSLSLGEIAALFDKLQAARGPLAKTPLLLNALRRCTPLEAKYLVKIITGDLRIGLKEGLVEDAVAAAFKQPAEDVRRAALLLGDIGEVARLAAAGRLADASLIPFRPVKLMLASPEETAAGVWERMHTGPAAADGETGAVWLEDKYDGIRCQLHKVGRRVSLFSRDLKDVTATFPELADAIGRMAGDFILDGEIVAMRGEEVLPFAELQRRLGRREADLFMREEVPIQFVAFDLLWLNQESLLSWPLRQRRKALEALPAGSSCLRFARITSAQSVEDIETAFDAARSRNNEGLMIKNPESLYTPGRRGLAWVKLKKAYATLDCVVVGAEYGHGRRSKVLSDYTFAVRDEATGGLKTIGKAYSGLTDVEIEQLTAHFVKTALRQHGRFFEVQPDTVLEIAFDRIQASNRHSSGLALRFPRIVKIRDDKPVAEIDTLSTARRLAERQAGRAKSEWRMSNDETNPNNE